MFGNWPDDIMVTGVLETGAIGIKGLPLNAGMF